MLSLENVRFSVDTEQGKKEILKGVSFTVDSPFTVITGPNGGGKSTIARLISGIYTPDSGRILYNGEDITALSVTERAKKGISYAFQTPVRFKGVTYMVLNATKDSESGQSYMIAHMGEHIAYEYVDYPKE